MATRIEWSKSFWKTLKSVSVAAIAREARQTFTFALIGSPEERSAALAMLFPGQDPEAVHPQVRGYASDLEADGFPQEPDAFDVAIDLRGEVGGSAVGSRRYCLRELGDWETVERRILDEQPKLQLSLARRFPGFRPAVSQRVIQECATANAEFAMLNALPGVIPVIGPILSPLALADILVLTKNQGMLLFRLAAVHDLPLDARSRGRDLAPLLANAFGWRAIARELAGFVPGGVGLVTKGAIAYAGTMALGKAIARLYETGQRPTKGQIAGYTREAMEAARRIAADIASRLPSGRRKRLPKGDTD